MNEWARKFANGPSQTFGMQEKLIEHSYTSTLEEILEQEIMTQTLMISTHDYQEGRSAFNEKRKPQFTGN